MYNLWSPKLKRGFFFVGDQQFYLFTDKQTIALLNALFFEFALDQFPASILEATCGTKTIVADDMIVDDRKVMFRNSALEDGHDIILTYTVQEISGDQIIQTPQVVSLDPVDATRRFFLDPVPVSGYPIIFTDDSISPFNGNEYMHSEFDVDEDTGEVTFFGADKNKLWNAAFSAWNTAPLNWTVSTDIVSLEHLRQEGYLTKDSIMFGRIPDVPSWDDYLFQKIVIEEKEETFTLSFWTKTWQYDDGPEIPLYEILAALVWMDVDGNFLDQDGTIYAADLATLHALTPPILLTELFDPSDEWGRENMTIGPEGPYGLTKPANAVAIGVYFSVLGTPLISNVQVEAAAEPTVFAYAPRLGTFEYEGSDEKYATIEQVDLNPANNGRVTGLLSIGIDINPDIDPELY